ncbi:DNA-3-methyladenine glycosylase [Lactiplantibacillus plantarum]|uniref:DNA-3-methyladenine glycosylase n=1 Tax=Lactiplantibacillus plantarum TaxID=1590 RepID=UPI0007E49A76|nr:DNA-3-methyladenine glycosylase [Lactiplantibacillus plantarum]ANJ13153.1 3-methyladenine DNA glycosylase [Lactiplantibacillus plantarum]MCB7177874.1 DNA-3-methyladenine glycosylase [Lactiplantibacillus plantarum]
MTAIERFLSTRTTPEIAASLLGKQLHLQTFSGVLTAWITETEAYLGARDAGAHAYQNHQTPRNRALWQSAGTIYIYQMRAWCLLNIVTQAAGTPECVLIRGIEPDVGLERMQQQRPVPIANLTNGPGKLMQALGLDKTLNGQTLQPATLSLDLSHYRQPEQVMATPRIGIVNKGEWTTAPLRYFVAGNPFVSKISRRTIDHEHHGWMTR